MTNKTKYLSHYGKICPVCESVDGIQVGPFRVKKKAAYRKCKCPHCKATWYQRWRLDGYERLKAPALDTETIRIEEGEAVDSGPLEVGTQIAYRPTYRRRQRVQADTEYGFVFEPVADGEYFHRCCFWSKKNPARLKNRDPISTVYNSNLVRIDSVPQVRVKNALESLGIK